MGRLYKDGGSSYHGLLVMTKRLAVVILGLIVSGSGGLSADFYSGRFFRFEQLTPQTATSSLVGISSICQDQEGFLWLGTSVGLARFDGYRFLFFFPPPPDNLTVSGPLPVYPVTPARNGDLWIGTNSAGLVAFSRETRAFVPYPLDDRTSPGPEGDIVLAVQEDANGDLWVGTRSRGLYRFDHATRAFARVPLGTGVEVIWDILVDRTGAIWVGTLGSGLFRIDPKTGGVANFRFVPGDSRSLGSDTVWTVFEDRDGALWAGTKNGGLNRFDAEDGNFTRFMGEGALSDDLTTQTITAMAEDRDGRLWLGTAHDGVRIWDRKTGTYVAYRHDPLDPESLGDNSVTSLLEDAGGVIWVGTVRGGLNKCLAGRAKFEHYKHNPSDPRSLSRGGVQALWDDGSGKLWIGTKTGLETLDRRKGASRQLDGGVLAVLGDAHGRIWIGTDGDGLALLEPDSGRLTRFKTVPGNLESLANNKVNALGPDAADPEVLWVGTQRGLNRIETRSGGWDRFVPDPGAPDSLVNPIVTALIDDGAGSIWVGTLGGLSRFDKASGRCENFVSRLGDPPGQSVSSNTVNCLHASLGPVLWVGTDAGLDRYDPATGAWRGYAQKDGLGGEVVCGILEDEDGALWLSTNRGLSRFDQATERFTNYGLHDGLQDRAFNPGAAFRSPDGRMSFGGGNGINVFHPADVRKDPFVPPVVWTALYRNNVEVELPRPPSTLREAILTYKAGLITFEFAALSFAAPEMNSFAYRLEPRDAEWILLVPEHSVSFYELGAGRYTLRVKAANPDGIWNEEGASIDLTVVGPFWKTWWFLLIVAALFASGLALAARSWKRIKSAPRALGQNLEGAIGTYGLTEREEEILGLVLRGARNRDIEKALFISASTVRNHISNIYRKLGVSSRLELVNKIARDARDRP
jgi:ligand-binding sensor domain-containing protein/DNA-binding CsgD family transcriptional regulator